MRGTVLADSHPGAVALERLKGAALHGAIVTLQKFRFADGEQRARINIENTRQLREAGFDIGARFDVHYSPGCVEVVRSPLGHQRIAPKRFRRRSGDVLGSRLDVRTRQVYEEFGGAERVLALYLPGRIVILDVPTAVRSNERIRKLANALDARTLRVASLYTGIGTLDLSLHEGFADVGLHGQTVFANDYLQRTVDCFLNDNPAASPGVRTFSGGIEEAIALGALPEADMVVMGIPCKGASKLNIRDRDQPELHPVAGHQVMNALLALQAMRFPPLILVENVRAWADTVSCSMLRRVLEEQGYETRLIGDHSDDGRYLGIDSSQYGDIERRVRMALLAYPRGLTLTEIPIEKCGPSPLSVGEIRLPETDVHPAEYDKGASLDSEHKRAKNFRNRVVDDDAHVTPSLSSECWKMRTEDPKFRHPEDPSRWRLPLPEEHARLKGHDPRIVDSLPFNSHAHSALGNGAVRGCWRAFGRALGAWLLASFQAAPVPSTKTRAALQPSLFDAHPGDAA